MILLFSGGMDSYLAWHHLDKPKTLYVNLSHRYADDEMRTVKKLIPNTIIESGRVILGDWEEEDANIPMRNAFLILVAAYYAPKICLVVQKGEMSTPDRTPTFMLSMEGAVSAMLQKPALVFTPFYNRTKTEMIADYLKRGGHPKLLLATRSCYVSGNIPCGECSACFRRWVALTNNGLKENYRTKIGHNPLIEKYIQKMKAGEYDPTRTSETFTALESIGISCK